MLRTKVPRLKPIKIPLAAIDDLEASPISEHWPEMKGQQWTQFLEGIRMSPRPDDLEIVLVSEDGVFRIADGRHRHRACVQLGLQKLLRFVVLDTDDEMERELFGLMRNGNRRHLTSTERGLLVYPIMCRAGLMNGEAAAAASIDRRTMQRIRNACDAGLEQFLKDKTLTLTEAADLSLPKNKVLLRQVKAGELDVREAGQKMKEKTDEQRRNNYLRQSGAVTKPETKDEVRQMSAEPKTDGVSRQTAEDLLKVNNRLMERGQELEQQLAEAVDAYNTLAIHHTYIMERLRAMGMSVDDMATEAKGFADSVSEEIVNGYLAKVHGEKPVPPPRSELSDWEEALAEAKAVAGYATMTTGQKSAFTRAFAKSHPKPTAS